MAARTHLAAAFRWSGGAAGQWPAMLAAGLGMAGPVLLAASLGRMEAGLAAAALAGIIAVLGGLRPWLRERSYLAYSAVMTPLVILILDAGRPVEAAILIDRLIATLIAAALVIAVNALIGRRLG